MDLSPKDKRNLISELWNQFINGLHSEMDDEDIYLNVTEFIVREISVFRQGKVNSKDVMKTFFDYFVCNVCTDMLLEPVTLSCGHTYCRPCLKSKDLSLCNKCRPDESSTKFQRLFFPKDNIIDCMQCDVTINSTIQKCLSDRAKGKKLRLEGNASFLKGDYRLCECQYLQSVQAYPESYQTYANLSHLKITEGCFDEALQFAHKCVVIAPLWCKGYYRQGVAYKSLLRYHEAADAFLKYLILEPNSVIVRKLLYESIKEVISSFNNGSDKNTLGKQNTKCFINNINNNEVVKNLLLSGIEFCISCHPAVTEKEDVLPEQLEILTVELTCPLCCRLLFNPCTTRCGHSFCSSCLERSLDYTSLCPICRRPAQELIVVRPKPINNCIDSLVKRYFPDEYKDRQDLLEKEVSIYDEDGVTIPIFVCSLALPCLEIPLHIFEPRYKLLIRRCLDTKCKMFGMCVFDEMECFVKYGVMLEIHNSQLLSDGRLLIETRGGRRFKVLERGKRDGYHTAKVTWIKDERKLIDEEEQVKQLSRNVYTACKSWLENDLPRLLRCRLQIEFGKLPDYNRDEMEDELGPTWIWWMIRLLTQGNTDDALKALKSTNHKERLELIENKLQYIRGLFSQNKSS